MFRSAALFAACGVLLMTTAAFAEPQESCSFHHDRCAATAKKAEAAGGYTDYTDKQTGQAIHAPLTVAMCDAEKVQCLKTGEWVGPVSHTVKKNLLKE